MRIITQTLPVLGALLLVAAPGEAQRKAITAQEIERSAAQLNTAFDVVNALRPRWLQQSHEVLDFPGSGADPRVAMTHVYQGGHDKGGVDYLKMIPADRVLTIRWLSTTEAGDEFGPSLGPAIVVELKH